MEHILWFAAAVGISVGASQWLISRAIAAIPKIEPIREVHFHKAAEREGFDHPTCDYCNLVVARHKMDSDSKIICANCAHERNM